MRLNHKRRACLIILLIVLGISLRAGLFRNNLSAESSNYALNMGVQEYSKPLEAQDFTLKDIDNNKISLKDYRGKVVMLNFWATWCAPCRTEMPSMERLYRQFNKRGFVILSVASGEKGEKVSKFIKEYNITFPALLDSDMEVTDHYKVWALPTTYIINAEGNIIGRINGSRDWATKEATQYLASLFKTSL